MGTVNQHNEENINVDQRSVRGTENDYSTHFNEVQHNKKNCQIIKIQAKQYRARVCEVCM